MDPTPLILLFRESRRICAAVHPGLSGKNILFSVARGRFILYRKAKQAGHVGDMPSASHDASRPRRAVSTQNSTGEVPQLSLSRTMFVLPCSGQKSRSASTSQGPSLVDFLSRELARELMTQRARNAERACVDESTLARAIDRYDGTLYEIARFAIDELIAKGAHVLVLSGGYGVVLATEPIGMYEARFRNSMWPDRVVERCLAEYASKTGITTVVGILSGSTGYAQAFRRTRWPSTLSQVLLVTPQRGTGAMVKAPRAQGEALVSIAASGKLGERWRSTDDLAMEIVRIETS
ncbi:MAG: hypothetical protein R3E86_17515 [Pseudomonadales bacterium]